MFSSTKQYVDLLCGLNITANQFLLCHLLYDDYQEDVVGARKKVSITYLYRYLKDSKRVWKRDEIDDLIERGYLIDNSRGKMSPDMLEVTEKFINQVYASLGRFKEFWDSYPKTMPAIQGGGHIKLKACDPDELQEVYDKIVKTNKLHNEILDLVKWADKNNQLNIGIEKFVKSRMWETLAELKERYSEDNMRVAR